MSPRSHSRPRKAAIRGPAPLFAALGDETRLRLVGRLCEYGPSSIAKLTAGEEVTRQAVSKHLRVMEEAGLVHVTREGRASLWRLEQPRIEDARRHLEAISSHWDRTLDRLKKHVDG